MADFFGIKTILPIAMSLLAVSQANAADIDFQSERYLTARSMLLQSCLGYAEELFPRADLREGVESLPGLKIANRGPTDPISFCQVTDIRDPDDVTYATLIRTIENEKSPLMFFSTTEKDNITTRTYRHKTNLQIGLVISNTNDASNKLDWIATVSYMDWEN